MIQATFRLFGEACLCCRVSRPLEMAHIRDWPTSVAFAGTEIGGIKPPRDWHYAVAVDNFHNISNVVPLCCNCHTLFDQKKYPDITECAILELRDEAIKRTDVLGHVINFIGIELSGRPSRCQHKTEDGKRKHTHVIDQMAAVLPMPWIADAYRAGTLTDNPHMIVRNRDGWHHHVRFDHGSISCCAGSLDNCADGARVWTRTRSGRTYRS